MARQLRIFVVLLLVCLAVGDSSKASPQSKTHVESETSNLLEELVGEEDGLLLSSAMNGTLIKSEDDLCLDTSQPFVEGSVLHMWLCDDNNVREQWDYDATTQQVRHSDGGLCLQAPTTADKLVTLMPCNAQESRQQWSFNTATGAITTESGECLAGSGESSGEVKVESCESGHSGQNWKMPKTHCKLTAWSPFTECTKTCGDGVQKRARAVMTDSRNGGIGCGHLVETRSCNGMPCSAAGSCQVGPWTKWTKCTHKCGGGKQIRTRDVLLQALSGGLQCPVLHEARQCNTHGCSASAQAAASVNGQNSRDTLPSETGLDAAKSLLVNATLTVEQADILKSCESMSPAISHLTLENGELQQQLEQVNNVLEALQAKLDEESDRSSALMAQNTNLTAQLDQVRLQVEQEQVASDAGATQPNGTSEELQIGPSALPSNTSNATGIMHRLLACREQAQGVEERYTTTTVQLEMLEAQFSEQSKELANCTLRESSMGTLSVEDAVAEAKMDFEVDKHVLNDCRSERDEIAAKLYQAGTDLLTCNMTYVKQLTLYQVCQSAQAASTSELALVAESKVAVKAEKNRFKKLLSQCQNPASSYN